MSKPTQFPAHSILDWYEEAEQMLGDFLKYVPYCDEHEEVWSLRLVLILQETCSQLDSLWRREATKLHGRNSTVNMTDYFELYRTDMAPRWVIFWGDDEYAKIQPFKQWDGTKEYSPLDWWKDGYQKIKHNRVENRTCANLKRTVEAPTALFLAIVRSESCWECLWARHWMSWDESVGMPYDPLDCLREDFGWLTDKNKCDLTYMAVETKLFAYPVGLGMGLHKALKNRPNWGGNWSRRLKAWYYDFCQRNGK